MEAFEIVRAIEKRRVIVIAADSVQAYVIHFESRANFAIADIHRIRATEACTEITNNENISA